MIAKVRKDKKGNLLFDSQTTNLKDIIMAAEEHFFGTDFNELLFPRQDWCSGNGFDSNGDDYALALGKLPQTTMYSGGVPAQIPGIIVFDNKDHLATQVLGYISLAQAVRQTRALRCEDFTRVRLFWFEGGLCMKVME